MNVFKHELRRNLMLTVVWSIVITGISAIVLSFYPVIQSDMNTYLQVLSNFPPALKSAMGIFTDLFTTTLGYYTFGLTLSLFFVGIHALIQGIRIVSKEIQDKTADFLMTKPVSRTSILSSKILASLTLLLASCLFFSMSMLGMLTAISSEKLNINVFILLCIAVFYVQTVFFFIGLLVSILAKRIRSVLPVALGIGFFFYALSAFAVTSESDKLRYLTPYEYIKPKYIIMNQSFEMPYFLLGFGIVLASLMISYYVYIHKDIHSV